MSPDFTRAVNRSVGAAVRETRDSCSMTQAALADAIGLSRASIANIERGEQSVTVPLLLRISSILGVPAATLLREPNADELALLKLPESGQRALDALGSDEQAKRWVAAVLMAGADDNQAP
jgi:transcriptional regulator with XRE-family HTH domain